MLHTLNDVDRDWRLDANLRGPYRSQRKEGGALRVFLLDVLLCIRLGAPARGPSRCVRRFDELCANALHFREPLHHLEVQTMEALLQLLVVVGSCGNARRSAGGQGGKFAAELFDFV